MSLQHLTCMPPHLGWKVSEIPYVFKKIGYIIFYTWVWPNCLKKIDNLKRHQNSVFVFHTSGSLIALFVPEISLWTEKVKVCFAIFLCVFQQPWIIKNHTPCSLFWKKATDSWESRRGLECQNISWRAFQIGITGWSLHRISNTSEHLHHNGIGSIHPLHGFNLIPAGWVYWAQSWDLFSSCTSM